MPGQHFVGEFVDFGQPRQVRPIGLDPPLSGQSGERLLDVAQLLGTAPMQEHEMAE